MRSNPWKRSAWLLVLMFLNYGLNAVSIRLLAKANYLGVAATDAAIAWYGFTMMKNVQQANTRLEKVGYTIGGVLGSLLGLWVTT
jgi:hypothetical protein